MDMSAISIEERRREDYGDLDALAESIRRYGLLHPIVIDDANRLVAGERRLRACQQLGWSEIDVRNLGELSEPERREIELEENLRRKDLTEYERAKVLVGLASVAGEVLRQQELSCTTHKNSATRGRGQPPKADSQKAVAERVNVDQSTISRSTNHVATVEEFFPTQGPAWPQYHVLEARSHLDKIPEPDRPKAAALIDQPAIPPRDALKILGNLAEMPAPERAKVLTLAESDDARDRSKALADAARLPAMPDPRATWLVGEVSELRKMAKLFPHDIFADWFNEKADEFKSMAKEIKEAHRDRNLSA